jgi:hypothetical protein
MKNQYNILYIDVGHRHNSHYRKVIKRKILFKFLSPTNAPLYYTYKMLKYTVKISHDCSYMFRFIWTIIKEPMPNLAKVTILCIYSVKLRR